MLGSCMCSDAKQVADFTATLAARRSPRHNSGVAICWHSAFIFLANTEETPEIRAFCQDTFRALLLGLATAWDTLPNSAGTSLSNSAGTSLSTFPNSASAALSSSTALSAGSTSFSCANMQLEQQDDSKLPDFMQAPSMAVAMHSIDVMSELFGSSHPYLVRTWSWFKSLCKKSTNTSSLTQRALITAAAKDTFLRMLAIDVCF